MKKILVIFLLLLFVMPSYAQWNPSNIWWSFNVSNTSYGFNTANSMWDFNPAKEKWDYNTIDSRWIQSYNAIEQVALQVSPHVTLSTAIQDAYPVLYSLKKLYSTASDSCVMLQRTLNSDSAWFGFANGWLDTASVRSWLDTNVVVNGTFDSGDNWSLETGITISGGTLNFTSAPSSNKAEQSNIIEVGKYYKYSIEISEYTEGGIRVDHGNFSELMNENGTFTGTILCSNNDVKIRANGTTTLKVDNFSVTEVTPSLRKWWDVSGNGNFAYQYNPDYQPIVDLDSFQVEFDGTNDYMTNTMGTFSQPYTVMITGTIPHSHDEWTFAGSTSSQLYMYNGWNMNAGVGLTYAVITDLNNITCMFNGVSSFMIMDGVKTEGNAGTNDITNLTIMKHPTSGTRYAPGSLENFIFSKYGLTETQCNSITTYLNQ